MARKAASRHPPCSPLKRASAPPHPRPATGPRVIEQGPVDLHPIPVARHLLAGGKAPRKCPARPSPRAPAPPRPAPRPATVPARAVSATVAAGRQLHGPQELPRRAVRMPPAVLAATHRRQRPGARHEGIHQRYRGLLKQGLEHHGRSAGWRRRSAAPDPRGSPACPGTSTGVKVQSPSSVLKGPLTRLHGDVTIGGKLVAGGELGVQRAAPHRDAGDDFPLGSRLNLGARAPRQKLRIAFNVVDQREHALRRLRDQCRASDFPHG